MTRPLSLLIGPELLWIVFYLLVAAMARANVPPSKSMDHALVNLAYLIPFLAVPLTFSLFFIPGIERNWLLLRVWLACIFGAHYALEKGLSAHSEQGPGVGTAYIMGMIFAFVALIAGSVLIKIRF